MSDDVERVEQCRAQLWRGMIWNRWLHRVALVVVLIALALAVLARAVVGIVLDVVLLAMLLTAHRWYVKSCVDSDRYWQESLDFWRERES